MAVVAHVAAASAGSECALELLQGFQKATVATGAAPRDPQTTSLVRMIAQKRQ